MAAEDERIVVKPDGHGSGVPMDVPGGFGKWFLHFPENMLLDGPGRGKAKMTTSVGDDGTTVVEGKMDGEFAHAIRITYKPGTETIDLTLEVPSHVTQVAIPGDLLEAGEEYQVEVYAKEVGGNQVYSQVTFVISG